MDGLIVFVCGCLIGTGAIRLARSVARALRGRCCESCRDCRHGFCPAREESGQK